MSDSLEESDSRAGFYYDVKFLISVTYVAFLILMILSGYIVSTGITVIFLVFLSLIFFLDLQEFVEVKVPRYEWKGSKSNYKVASVLLALGILLVPIVDFLMNTVMVPVSKMPSSVSIALFIFSIGLLAIPILGIIFYLIFLSNFASSHGFSLWQRDKEILEVCSKHSFIYPKLFRRKKRK